MPSASCDGRRQPFNSPANEPLRRLELLFFCALVLLACAAFVWRGVQLLAQGPGLLPLLGLYLPWPLPLALAVFLFALSGVIALATLALFLRFLRA